MFGFCLKQNNADTLIWSPANSSVVFQIINNLHTLRIIFLACRRSECYWITAASVMKMQVSFRTLSAYRNTENANISR